MSEGVVGRVYCVGPDVYIVDVIISRSLLSSQQDAWLWYQAASHIVKFTVGIAIESARIGVQRILTSSWLHRMPDEELGKCRRPTRAR